MIRTALALVLFSSGPGLACGLDGRALASAESDAPQAYVRFDRIPLAQPFALEVEVCGGRDVDDLRVDAIMPAHQHGMNYVPTVMATDDDVFKVQGMLFHMPGLWQLQVDLQLQERVVHYTYPIELR